MPEAVASLEEAEVAAAYLMQTRQPPQVGMELEAEDRVVKTWPVPETPEAEEEEEEGQEEEALAEAPAEAAVPATSPTSGGGARPPSLGLPSR